MIAGPSVLAAGTDGSLFPSRGGTTVDSLQAIVDLRRADSIAGPLLDFEPAARARMVAAPLATLAPDDRPTRWLAGSPDAEGFAAVLSEREVADGLWLPHHHAVLRSPGGPVAVRVRDGRSSFTWADGVGLTLPAGDQHSPVLGDTSRFERQPSVSGIPVLNGVAEVVSPFAGFEPIPPGQLGAALHGLGEGLGVLHEVWPQAFLDVLRLCRGTLLLSNRDWSRSHSPKEAPGLVLLSVDGPEKVADLLCHECSHVRLNLLLAVDPLLENADEGGYESPWRPDPRPLLGLLLGVHAFLSVVTWYRRLQRSPLRADIWSEVAKRQAANVVAGWTSLEKHARPTAVGFSVMEELAAAVEAMEADA